MDTPTPQRNGLKTALDTVVAPKDAFESLRAAPTWGWALLIATVLLLAGFALQRPAQLHAAAGTIAHMFATNSMFSNMTDAQKQRAIESATHPSSLQTAFGAAGTILSLFMASLINTVVLMLGAIAGRGNADFRRLWAGSINIAVPTWGINYVVLGAICIALGPDHFQTNADLLRSVPGAAMLAPGASGFLGGALIAINVFALWGFGLNVAMMRVMAGVQNAAAWIAPLIVLLGGAALSGAISNFYGG